MSLSNEIERLAELHQRGQLSDDEFQRAKERLLQGLASEPSSAYSRAQTQPGRKEQGLGSAINRLQRSREERWLGGVCGGLMEISGTAAWIWRLIFLAMLFCHGAGLLAYLVLWLLVPEAPKPVPGLGWQNDEGSRKAPSL